MRGVEEGMLRMESSAAVRGIARIGPPRTVGDVARAPANLEPMGKDGLYGIPLHVLCAVAG
jgi:hypothetical protein